MIHRLHDRDAVEMLARAFPRASSVTVVDVGAHTGKFSARVLEVFPNARIIAIEPSPEPFEMLRTWAEGRPGVTPVQVALGAEPATLRMAITANPMLTSVLSPTARSSAISGGAAEVVSEVTVAVRRLDDVLAEHGVETVHLLKVDVQGYEVPVLNGAHETLARSRAVYSEAHTEPLYDGASTFSEVDLALRAAGLGLHQIHELTTQGEDLQTTCLDGLWLDRPTLETVRERPLEVVRPPWAVAFLRTLDRCAAAGHRRVAMYGAGTHTRSIEPWLAAHEAVSVKVILDDNPSLHGTSIAGREIIGVAGLDTSGAEAVVLSSDYFEDELWQQTAGLRRRGVPVYRLYGPEREAEAPGA